MCAMNAHIHRKDSPRMHRERRYRWIAIYDATFMHESGTFQNFRLLSLRRSLQTYFSNIPHQSIWLSLSAETVLSAVHYLIWIQLDSQTHPSNDHALKSNAWRRFSELPLNHGELPPQYWRCRIHLSGQMIVKQILNGFDLNYPLLIFIVNRLRSPKIVLRIS